MFEEMHSLPWGTHRPKRRQNLYSSWAQVHTTYKWYPPGVVIGTVKAQVFCDCLRILEKKGNRLRKKLCKN